MKEFSISIKTVGEEFYKVNSETFEEAVNLIKEGLVNPDMCESEWDSEFYLDDEKEIL